MSDPTMTQPQQRTARSLPWDGVLRAREWILLGCSLAAIVVLLPPWYLLLLFVVAAVAFLIGSTSLRRNQKMLLIVAAVIGFVIVRQVRYPPPISFVLWTGTGIAAFFILRVIDYAVTRHDPVPGETLADRLGKFALYVFFLPTLFAGPVLSYRDLYRSYAPGPLDMRALPRNLLKITWGAVKFFGLFSVLLRVSGRFEVAAVTGSTSVRGLPFDVPTFVSAWAAVSLTLVFVYVGFSGFSDMGTGLARILGFHVYENFDMPLLAPSPLAFWQRSNISTYRWLMTNVFFPYWDHDQIVAKILTTFAVSGLWHVAAIRVISTGAVVQLMSASLINAIGVLAVFEYGRRRSASVPKDAADRRPARQVLSVCGTFLFTALVFKLFWAGIGNQPVSHTLRLFRALVPGMGPS